MKYYIGVDGGGTKTHVVCMDENDTQVGEGVAGPTNLTATNVGAASFNLREGIRQATEHLPEGADICCLCMGLAGMDTPSEEATSRKIFTDALSDYHIEHIILVNDTIIGLESDTDKDNALVLISGTGSSCVGRNEAHQTAKAGGYDFLLSDQGSGYWIGHQVLRAAMASFDHTGPKTMLEELVMQQYEIKSIAELKDHVYNPLLGKNEVAESSMLCSHAFEKGDPIAKQLFDQAITDLYTMASTVINRLHMADKEADLVLVGSITKVPYINENLCNRLRADFPLLNIKNPEKAPVYGALKIAKREAMKQQSPA